MPTTLRAACLNVWGVPLVAQDLEDRLDRMVPALRSLEPDLICLQEVFLASTRARVVEGLGSAYTCTEGTAGGLLIASRFPVEETSFTAFPIHPRLPFAERLARKGFLEAVVVTPAGRLRVVTTHLAAEWSADGPRREQQDLLLEALEARTDVPLLLAGDLNVAVVTARGPTEAWEAFRGRGFEHAEPPRQGADGVWRRPSPTRVGWPRAGARRSWTPDHVLLRSTSAVAADFVSFSVGFDTPETAVSDHNLLFATLRLAPR